MTRTHVKSLSIAAGNSRSSLTKAQKAFNALIRQIEKKRARFAAWEAAIPAYQKKYADEMDPLMEDLVEWQTRMVQRLDRAGEQKGLTRIERHTIAGVITGLAGELIAARGDAEMKAIYNRYSPSDYDSDEAAEVQDMKSALEDMLGVDLGDDLDLGSPEEVLDRAQAQILERQAQDDADRLQREERLAGRKKSARQLAREAQQQAEERQLRQSISGIYRKLVSALHPDRETDPQERERKTVLMQRVNDAYGKNNLLQLLELQLELEHIDQSVIDTIGEDRLKHYNRILKDQLAELDEEILRIEDGFRAQFGLSPFQDVAPRTLMRDLEAELVSVRHTIRDMKKDLLAFESMRTLKAWLKAVRHRAIMDDVDDLPF